MAAFFFFYHCHCEQNAVAKIFDSDKNVVVNFEGGRRRPVKPFIDCYDLAHTYTKQMRCCLRSKLPSTGIPANYCMKLVEGQNKLYEILRREV